MNTDIIHPVGNSSLQSHLVLNEERMCGTLTLIAPGQEIAPNDDFASHEHVLFVAEGSVTLRIGDLFHVLNQDQALRLAPGQMATLCNDGHTWAKVLLLELQVPAPVDPLLVELPRP